ncbi:unnamed protein product [Didymodactylos carnosus]|uniref:DDE-1 domain-containing protein n=1 Tax=Didymodactylos carnosus TaxID=1234261 RepID=A0A814B4R7_9BILA|nr:unnamed protein product [Didymodactylos carnosus]CAF1093110.1 unnamed protein product [Didymodactylos carnosus]CAF3702604.1 unnamed protein product [Didymodactylos carnosus]CAF3854598.1 unnamed protein product [Didymodactylos carnosus]
MDKPSQIFNCDESGFADKTDTSKVIAASPTKFPYKNQGPDGTGYNTSKNGWMEENIFFQWFKNMFIPLTATTPKPILLLLDGHTSHQSVRTVELAIEHNIIL